MVVLDGKNTKFWFDKWLLPYPHVDLTTANMDDILPNQTVFEFKNARGEQDWNKLNTLFTNDVLLTFLGTKAPEEGNREDESAGETQLR